MSDFLFLVGLVVAAVVATTVLYKTVPFKRFKDGRKGFTLFPKYTAHYEKSLAEIYATLEAQEFIPSSEVKNRYTRGKVYGDFSARNIKLVVEVDDAKKEVKVYAPGFGILFDTGDVWQLTKDIVG